LKDIVVVFINFVFLDKKSNHELSSFYLWDES
jgi:hypothetical protein